MNRLKIICLLGLAWGISQYLKDTTEGLSETSETGETTSEDQKDGSEELENPKILKTTEDDKVPDHYLDRDNRNVQGLISLQDKAAVLYTMTPQFINNRLNESSYKYRWIASDWPECSDKCSSKAITRKVSCWGRNEKPYADDTVDMKGLYSNDFSKKDEFGKTKCDYQNAGISVNVKPAEQTFCSLINNCGGVNREKMNTMMKIKESEQKK